MNAAVYQNEASQGAEAVDSVRDVLITLLRDRHLL